MFHPVAYDVRSALVDGVNELEITFANTLDYLEAHREWQPFPERNDPVGGRSRIRKAQYHYSWDWGPRFVTCGVWRPIRLVGWTGGRLGDVGVWQNHHEAGVTLSIGPQIEGDASENLHLKATASHDGVEVAAAEAAVGEPLELEIPEPQLWWPAGQGAQPLYSVTVELMDADGRMLGQKSKRIGLRTIELVQEKDAGGESFFFRVNGRAIFSKGANWIPDHMFTTECDEPRYRERLQAAVDANMNMLRVWGGGIYEEDTFYDLCDELGLLIWQDFMFACALYPGSAEYCEVLKPEADYQVRRLQHHACLALWCGNNEIPYMGIYGDELKRDPAWAANYARVFHELLPQAVEEHDGATPYWPSSPWTPAELFSDPNAERAGDVHYWDVWHSRAPVKNYEGLHLRFCSEFGMQSYASIETARTFCPESELNVFSRTMENHQKNGGGNATMLHYMAKRYRYAEGYANLAYLSQLSQAYCMKVGVEHFRHEQPFTMGALYWQINDVWPVASWSSIEFGGRWKALHHEARRFLAPTLLYARAVGEVAIGRYNAIDENISAYALHVVSDAPEEFSATLVWSTRTLAGELVGEEQSQTCLVKHLASDHLATAEFPTDGDRKTHYLRSELRNGNGAVISRQNHFFTEPRFVDLVDPEISWDIAAGSAPGHFVLTLTARSFAHAVALSFGPDLNPWWSDNWFDLHAEEALEISIRFDREDVSLSDLKHAFSFTSLWHSYQVEWD